MTRQIDQLENNQTYLQEIVERYGLEASPELEEAKRKIAAYEKSIGRTESMINQASTEQILAYGKKCESYLNFGNSVDRVLHPMGKSVSKTRSCFSLYDTGNFKRSWSERFAHAYHAEAYRRLFA